MDKGKHLRGAARDELAVRLKAAYESGASIRTLARAHGRSYGTVHRILAQHSAVLRSRGGVARDRTPTLQVPAAPEATTPIGAGPHQKVTCRVTV